MDIATFLKLGNLSAFWHVHLSDFFLTWSKRRQSCITASCIEALDFHIPRALSVKGLHHDVTSIFLQPLHSWRQEKVEWKGLRNASKVSSTIPTSRTAYTSVNLTPFSVPIVFQCGFFVVQKWTLRSQHWGTELFAFRRPSPRPPCPNDLVVCPGRTQMQTRGSYLIPFPGSLRSSSCRIQ